MNTIIMLASALTLVCKLISKVDKKHLTLEFVVISMVP